VNIAEKSGDYRTTLALLRRMAIREKLGQDDLAAQDAELARSLADTDGNVDHATRAAVWLAARAVRTGTPGAVEALRDTLAAAEAVKAKLRPPTQQLMQDARTLIASA
jgi:hypothetical protein